MKVIAVTQARYGSTRLPAKVLKKVGDETLLDIHLQRILRSEKITSDRKSTRLNSSHNNQSRMPSSA